MKLRLPSCLLVSAVAMLRGPTFDKSHFQWAVNGEFRDANCLRSRTDLGYRCGYFVPEATGQASTWRILSHCCKTCGSHPHARSRGLYRALKPFVGHNMERA